MACTLPTCLWKWRFPGTRPPPVWEPPVAVFTVQWQSQAVWQGLYGLQICKISPVWLFSESWPVTEMIPPIPSRSTILESWVLSSRFWYLIFLGLYSFALEWSKILHGLESPLISWTTSQKKSIVEFLKLNSSCLSSIYYRPGTILCSSWTLPAFIFSTVLWVGTTAILLAEEAEAQKG